MKYLVLAIAVFSTACTTLSRQQCESVDWKQQGYKAGIEGHDLESDMNYWNQVCGEDHNIRPVRAFFEEEFKKGNAALCTKEGGYNFGRSGGVYAEQCSEKLEDQFFAGYQRGQSIYASKKLASMTQEITDLKRELGRKDSEISNLESKVRSLESENSSLKSQVGY